MARRIPTLRTPTVEQIVHVPAAGTVSRIPPNSVMMVIEESVMAVISSVESKARHPHRLPGSRSRVVRSFRAIPHSLHSPSPSNRSNSPLGQLRNPFLSRCHSHNSNHSSSPRRPSGIPVPQLSLLLLRVLRLDLDGCGDGKSNLHLGS